MNRPNVVFWWVLIMMLVITVSGCCTHGDLKKENEILRGLNIEAARMLRASDEAFSSYHRWRMSTRNGGKAQGGPAYE